jgi:hypothetical protein
MKNKPIDSGPLNKNFLQPPEADPIDEMLEAMKKKAEQMADGVEVIMNAIEKLAAGGGGTTFDIPIVILSPCQYKSACGMQPDHP